jgi:formylglycine-generating enzyme required for sulfatase activity
MTNDPFINFHVIIRPVVGGGADNYVVSVADAPVSRYDLPFEALGCGANWRQALTFDDAMIGTNRSALFPQTDSISPASLPLVGEKLFDLLFPQSSRAYHLLEGACQIAGFVNKKVRLRLDVTSDLADLPWELMRCPANHGIDILITGFSIVRYLGDIFYSAAPDIAANQKRHVILIKADPVFNPPLNPDISASFEREFHHSAEWLRSLSGFVAVNEISGKSTLRQLAATVDSIVDNGEAITGLHFIGHGGYDETLGSYFFGEDQNSKPAKIYQGKLQAALQGASSIVWVLFNACFVGKSPIGCPLAGLATSMSVVKKVPLVIAYRRPIHTRVAEELAELFYSRVLANPNERPVEEVIGQFQTIDENPGGLILLQRSVLGKDAELFIKRKAGSDTDSAKYVVQPPSEPQLSTPRSEVGTRSGSGGLTRRLDSLILIPAGNYQRGLTQQQLLQVLKQFKESGLAIHLDSTEEALRGENVETIPLANYRIARTLVTNEEFKRFVESLTPPYETTAESQNDRENWRKYMQPDKMDHPVVNVSYRDAEAYCKWARLRLPTADEWKKACRGPAGNIYPWGPTFDPMKCNTAESCQGKQTTPVTQFPEGRSSYGCYDMVGNVEEWTATHGDEENMVIIGGSWCMTCQVFGLPVLHRLGRPDFYSNDLGFRCAADV